MSDRPDVGIDIIREMDALDQEWSEKAAGILLSRSNAVLPGWTQRRHRLLQRRLTFSRRKKPDYLILGSSRQGFHGALSKTAVGINVWINSAMLGDRLFTHRMCEDSFGIPDLVIVGVDPWTFDAGARRMGEFRKWSLPVFAHEYDLSSRDYPDVSPEEFYMRWGPPLSEYAKLAIRSVEFTENGIDETYQLMPSATDKSEHSDFLVAFPDGSFEHRVSYRDRPINEVWNEASRWGAAYGWYMLREFMEPEPFLWKVFTTFVSTLVEKKRKCIIHLPPFHPAAYHAYELVSRRMQYPLLQEMERSIRDFAAAKKLIVIGSFNPEKCNATAEDFVDGWHVRRSVMPQLLSDVLK